MKSVLASLSRTNAGANLVQRYDFKSIMIHLHHLYIYIIYICKREEIQTKRYYFIITPDCRNSMFSRK